MDTYKGYLTPSEIATVLGGITVQGVYKIIKTLGIETMSLGARNKVIPPASIRTILESKGFVYPRKNISLQIVKGGVGKTALSHLLSVRASHYGAKVLVIDADQQGNLTKSLGAEARDAPVLLNLVRDECLVTDAIIPLGGYVDLIPSNLNNSRLDMELTQSNANLQDLLTNMLAPVRDNYDLVVIDCPPAINKINTSVSCASDLVIVPINPDPYAMDGLDFTLSELKMVKKNFRQAKFDYKIVWNKYDARERLGAYYLHELAKDAELIEHILPVVIGVDVTTKNAIHDEESVFDRRKKSTIREDSDQFTRELLGINLWMSTVKDAKRNQANLMPA